MAEARGVPFERSTMRERAGAARVWDVAVVGGGATGLGVALDAAARGYAVVLFEAIDFAAGTSSRSTKLIHGGVRYLRQGHVGLVRQALAERRRLRANAPGMVHPRRFVIPTQTRLGQLYYAAGLGLYDVLARDEGTTTERLNAAELAAHLPGLRPERGAYGVAYVDAVFDDARLALALARTTASLGGVVLNHAPVTGFLEQDGRVRGVRVRDACDGSTFDVEARVVVNAAGPWVDAVRRLRGDAAAPLLTLSRGTHIVLDAAFFPGDDALLVPRTDDGRVVFVVPWHGAVLVGTTDLPVGHPSPTPRPTDEEIDYLLTHAATYLRRAPSRADIRSTFAGLRALVGGAGQRTADVKREHLVLRDAPGLLSAAGGKWTTYRYMAEDIVDHAAEEAGLPARPCPTASLPLVPEAPLTSPNGVRLHERHPLTVGAVERAVRNEMAMGLEDVLGRRSRLLFVDVEAALEIAPRVAGIMAGVLGKDEAWARGEAERFATLARSYRVHPTGAPTDARATGR